MSTIRSPKGGKSIPGSATPSLLVTISPRSNIKQYEHFAHYHLQKGHNPTWLNQDRGSRRDGVICGKYKNTVSEKLAMYLMRRADQAQKKKLQDSFSSETPKHDTMKAFVPSPATRNRVTTAHDVPTVDAGTSGAMVQTHSDGADDCDSEASAAIQYYRHAQLAVKLAVLQRNHDSNCTMLREQVEARNRKIAEIKNTIAEKQKHLRDAQAKLKIEGEVQKLLTDRCNDIRHRQCSLLLQNSNVSSILSNNSVSAAEARPMQQPRSPAIYS